MARTWVRRGLGVCVLALIGAGAWAAFNWDSLQAKYAVHKLKSADDEAERAKWADALAARDPDALLALGTDPGSSVRNAATSALAKHLESLPPSDPHGGELARHAVDAFLACSGDAEREALVSLLPVVVPRAGSAHTAKSRSAVSTALSMPAANARVCAIRAAASLSMRVELVPLLSAPEAEVRRAALFAIGPAADAEPVIGDEELFHWLHDPDADVRTICRAALVSRGRSDSEIGLGKKLVDPNAAERLTLLLELRYEEELADVEPWLERLSRDADPGVRAGAARVVMEINRQRGMPAPAWVVRIVESDPQPTVRRIAKFYSSPLAGPSGSEIRLIEGP